MTDDNGQTGYEGVPAVDPGADALGRLGDLPSDKAPPHSAPPPRAVGTDVPAAIGMLAGLALAVAFYSVMAGFRTTGVGLLFFERGPIPYVEVFLAAWAVALLSVKALKLRSQQRVFTKDLLPTSLGSDITVENAEAFRQHLAHLLARYRNSLLLRRLVRALDRFRARPSRSEVATLLAAQSEIDTASVVTSYALLKVFIWAIPILGFVGTVLGISDAVGGFSELLQEAEELDVIKNSLTTVTTGLAVAFDTTLLALLLSMLVMFPASALQKAEQRLLNRFDEYCNEHLLRRLSELSQHDEELRHVCNVVRGQIQLCLAEAGNDLAGQFAAGFRTEVTPAIQDAFSSHVSAISVFEKSVGESTAALREVHAGVVRASQEQARQLREEAEKAATDTARTIAEVVSPLLNSARDLTEELHVHANVASAAIGSAIEPILAKAEKLVEAVDGATDRVERFALAHRDVVNEAARHFIAWSSQIDQRRQSATERLVEVVQSHEAALGLIAEKLEQVGSLLQRSTEDQADSHRELRRIVELLEGLSAKIEARRGLQTIHSALSDVAGHLDRLMAHADGQP